MAGEQAQELLVGLAQSHFFAVRQEDHLLKTEMIPGVRVVGGDGLALHPFQCPLHPGAQDHQAERFGDVVVGAQGKACDLVNLQVVGGQHQDGDGGSLADLAQQAIAAAIRQVDLKIRLKY